MVSVRSKFSFKISDILSLMIYIYIIGISLGTATRYIHKRFDYIMVVLIILFQVLQIIRSPVTRGRMKNLLVHNLLFKFAVMWCVMGSLLYLLYSDGNLTQDLVYRTMVISVFTIIIIVLNSKNKDDVYKYMSAMIVGMLINYSISIYELSTHNHIGEVLGPHMVSATFVGLSNNNNYATFLLYCVPLIFILFSQRKRSFKEKMLFLVILCANFFFNYNTGSNAGIIGSGLIILMGIYINWLYKKFNRKSIKLLTILFLSLYVLAFIIILGFVILGKGSSFGRLSFIYRAGNEFVKTLGLGLGPGRSQIVNNGWVHNLLFELLFEYGVFIFFMFCACWMKILLRCNKQYVNSSISGYVFTFILLLPMIWISSSSAMSLHFTWINFTLLYQYFCDKDIIESRVYRKRN